MVLGALLLELARAFEAAPEYARGRLAAELRTLVTELQAQAVRESEIAERRAKRERQRAWAQNVVTLPLGSTTGSTVTTIAVCAAGWRRWWRKGGSCARNVASRSRGEDWDLSHTPDRQGRAPEHRKCNRNTVGLRAPGRNEFREFLPGKPLLRAGGFVWPDGRHWTREW